MEFLCFLKYGEFVFSMNFKSQVLTTKTRSMGKTVLLSTPYFQNEKKNYFKLTQVNFYLVV